MAENEVQDVDLENNEVAETSSEEPQKSRREIELELELERTKSEAAKFKRIATREKNKNEKEETSVEKQDSSKEPSQPDYGLEAFLISSGLNTAEERQLAKDFAKRTGESYEIIVADDVFKGRLEKLRTSKANELAADTNNRRTGTSGKDEVPYWLSKLGPNDQIPADLPRELREKIVDARKANSKSSKTFYND